MKEVKFFVECPECNNKFNAITMFTDKVLKTFTIIFQATVDLDSIKKKRLLPSFESLTVIKLVCPKCVKTIGEIFISLDAETIEELEKFIKNESFTNSSLDKSFQPVKWKCTCETENIFYVNNVALMFQKGAIIMQCEKTFFEGELISYKCKNCGKEIKFSIE